MSKDNYTGYLKEIRDARRKILEAQAKARRKEANPPTGVPSSEPLEKVLRRVKVCSMPMRSLLREAAFLVSVKSPGVRLHNVAKCYFKEHLNAHQVQVMFEERVVFAVTSSPGEACSYSYITTVEGVVTLPRAEWWQRLVTYVASNYRFPRGSELARYQSRKKYFRKQPREKS